MTGSQTLQNLRSRMLRLPGLAIMVVAVLTLGVVLIWGIRDVVPTAHAANIVVDSALDTAHVSDLDGNGANNGAEVAETVCGIAGIPTAPTGACTLRAALYVASSNGDTADNITFGIVGAIPLGADSLSMGPCATNCGANLVADNTTIIGPTVGSDPSITVDCGGATPTAAFTITGASNTIRGLNIIGCDADTVGLNDARAILITGDAADSNKVVGNYIGTNAAGLACPALPADRNDDGVVISGSADSNQIGGATAADRNVISCNQNDGVDISGVGTGSNGVVPASNVVENNYIGTDDTGTAALTVQVNGVVDTSSSNNNIKNNVISGHSADGINTTSSGGTISGNKIGTNAAGTAILANGGDGIELAAAQGYTIGGATDGNIISGNGANGIRLTGIASANTIEGNNIGTNFAGTGILANTLNGVLDTSSSNNNIKNNLISGNGADGINTTSNGGVISGNQIGTNAAGTAALANVDDGIELAGATGYTIGGIIAADRNLISGNGDIGVHLSGVATTNVISGNYIGTNAAGTGAIANVAEGIRLVGSVGSNTVGGATAGHRNIISGNGADGILLAGTSVNNVIEGNYIGTDVSGNVALANTLIGINNLTSGGQTIAKNVVSGNVGDGVGLFGGDGNIVQNNNIGIGADGFTPLGNGGSGVVITSSSNQIGGGTSGTPGIDGSGQGNIIAYSGADGITLSGVGSDFNRFRLNSIFLNAAGGLPDQPIDMAADGFVTECPPAPPPVPVAGDGSNENVDCPDVDAITFNPGSPSTHTITVSGNVLELLSGSKVDLYKADANGEPKTYLGTATIFNDTVTATGIVTVCGLASGDDVVGIATDTVSNSSEVSSPVRTTGFGTSNCLPLGLATETPTPTDTFTPTDTPTNTPTPDPDTGTIEICKETNPNDSGPSFDFNGDLGDIDLHDDECETFINLSTPDSYSIDESDESGWVLVDIDCSGTSASNITVDLAASEVTIDLDDGDDVSCEFLNVDEDDVTPTVTGTVVSPTGTPTLTPTSTTVPPTETPVPTNTPVPTSTNTPVPTNTPTNTPIIPATPGNTIGDVNKNGVVNAIDAQLIKQAEAGFITLANPKNADVNLDGTVNILDAFLIQQFVAGLIPSLPA